MLTAKILEAAAASDFHDHGCDYTMFHIWEQEQDGVCDPHFLHFGATV